MATDVLLFSRDSEAAFGRRKQTATDVLFFLGIQRRRLAPKVEPGEARFGR